ncbi:AraC family transcriptional regulator [Siculibacillus lacustris]|nr:helix-turn-helix domain-containing protein [Siculibacillus lacustris]
MELATLQGSNVLDVETVEDSMDLKPAEGRSGIDWTPIAHGARSTFAVVHLGPLRLLGANLPPSLFEGTIREARYTVWLGMEDPHRSVVNGMPLPDAALVLGGPGSRCQSYWPIDAKPAQAAAALFIPAELRPAGWPDAAPLLTVHLVDPAGLQRLRQHLRATIRLASAQPERFAADGDRRAMGAEVVARVANLLATATVQTQAKPGFSRACIEMLDQIDRFIVKRLDRPILLGDVADALRVAPRTVHNIMKLTRGMTLQTYVTIFRMRSARRHLLRTEDCDLVKQAALRHGFVHLGRFAQAYARFFGETPSTTLARRRVEGNKAENAGS